MLLGLDVIRYPRLNMPYIRHLTQFQATVKVNDVGQTDNRQRLLKNVQLIGKSECVQDGFMLKYYRSSLLKIVLHSHRKRTFGNSTGTTTLTENFQNNDIFFDEP